MSQAGPSEAQHSVGLYFDDYVRRVFPARRDQAGADWAWPGDEWVDAPTREATYARLVGGRSPDDLSEIVEIGPGSGKYTAMLLDRTRADVIAYEISAAFIASLEERCAAAVASGRLRARHIAWTDNRALLQTHGSAGTADLFFAIDVFLMMDFQSVLAYLVSAAVLLKPGGRFFATFGDGTSDSGWERMMRDLGRHSAFDASPSTRFFWIDPGMIEYALARLGFEDVTIVRGPDGGLDIARLYCAGTLTHAMPLERALSLLAPAGDSTNRPARPSSA